MIREKCSSCKSKKYYQLDTRKTELRSLLSINENKNDDENNQAKKNRVYILIDMLNSLLLNDNIVSEKHKNEYINVYNNLKTTIVNKQKKIFKSKDKKLHSVCRKIYKSLKSLSKIYLDIQTSYHQKHNHKEINQLFQYENELNNKENALKQKEYELNQKENDLNQKEFTYKQKENDFNNITYCRSIDLNNYKNNLIEKERFLHNFEKILTNQEHNLKNIEKNIEKIIENSLIIRESSYKFEAYKYYYDDINNLLYSSNNFNSIDDIKICKSKLINLIKAYDANFTYIIKKLIPNLDNQLYHKIKIIIYTSFIKVSRHKLLNDYIDEHIQQSTYQIDFETNHELTHWNYNN